MADERRMQPAVVQATRPKIPAGKEPRGPKTRTETALGYVVLSKRLDIRGTGLYEYQPAGSVWSTVEPCENHRAYCQMNAETDQERYGDVEYVIGRITLVEDGDTNG